MKLRRKTQTKKNEKIKALRIRPGLDGIDLVELNVDDEIAKDPNYNKEYALSEATIPFNHSGKTDYVHLIDGGKGVTVKLERSDKKEKIDFGDGEEKEVSLLTMATSPAKISAIIDTTLMQRAYALRPDRRSIAIAFFLGIALGFFFGLFF